MNPAVALPARESALAVRWSAGVGGTLRLEDGRRLHVVFPGVPGGSAGPDFTGAILEAEGDLLRGDVELHMLASGWRAHRHDRDPAYEGVVLHVVGANDESGALTGHRSGRMIPILVLPPQPSGFPDLFTPPCAIEAAKGLAVGPLLERLAIRRLRMKAARFAPNVAAGAEGQALYGALLETLGGPANRNAFLALALGLPLSVLLEHADEHRGGRALAAAAHLKGTVHQNAGLQRSGFRPMASPQRRLEVAGALVARLWPHGTRPGWPPDLEPDSALKLVAGAGVSRGLASECMVNAVLPVALAAGKWPESEIVRSFLSLRGPGTYGRLKPLERWLGIGNVPVFDSAAKLQGALLLHADYCTRGRCGRCPLSE